MTFRALPALVAALAAGMGLAQAGPQPALHYAASQNADAKAAQAWQITEIGTLGGATATATAINDGGAVVGWSQKAGADPRGPNHPFLYQKGQLTDLGTLAGGPDSNFSAYAAGINAGGTVVGNSNSRSARMQAFVYSNGTMTAIGSTISSQATAISNNGYIAGAGIVPTLDNPGPRAFVYRNGSLTDLGTLGGPTSVAYAVNDSGMAAGASDFDSSGTTHAFLYRNGSMIDLNPFEGRYSAATAMNNLGQVVGFGASSTGAYHAFLYANSRAIDLHNALGATPNAQSMAQGINDAGEIVGVTFADQSWSAFLYCEGNVTRLEALPAVKRAGWTQLNPVAINKNGDITGTGVIRGNSRPFLLSRNGVH